MYMTLSGIRQPQHRKAVEAIRAKNAKMKTRKKSRKSNQQKKNTMPKTKEKMKNKGEIECVASNLKRSGKAGEPRPTGPPATNQEELLSNINYSVAADTKDHESRKERRMQSKKRERNTIRGIRSKSPTGRRKQNRKDIRKHKRLLKRKNKKNQRPERAQELETQLNISNKNKLYKNKIRIATLNCKGAKRKGVRNNRLLDE